MSTIQKPDLYHGMKKETDFFEGWYFKIVDKNNLYKFAFIPGISLGKSVDEQHSFIQIVDGFDVKYNYIRYPKSDFKYNNDKFNVGINSNSFSLNNVSLDLEYDNKYINGNLQFKNIVKWKDSLINPGSMGFYNYLTFMECYSQVCALDGEIIGALDINGKLVNFTGGKVYIEKNWGKSFPKSWLWIQSNGFEGKSASVTCSLGSIPFPIRDFTGFLIAVTVGDKFYSFTTINRSKMSLNSMGEDIELVVTKGKLKLTLKTHTNKNEFVMCMGPKDGDMMDLVNETLGARVEMRLEDTKSGEVIFDGVGSSTGVEYGGDFKYILD